MIYCRGGGPLETGLNDFETTFAVNNRPFYMTLSSHLVWRSLLDIGSCVVDKWYRFPILLIDFIHNTEHSSKKLADLCCNSVVGDKSEEEVTKLAVDHVSRILKINAPIHRCHTSLLPQCIAQYTVGHLGRLAKARTLLRSQGLPLELVGSSYDGPGINDTIMSAKRAVIH